ncbi:MAG: hypothetical protein P3A58_08070 [Gemmatimonadota bacterium]|nr:hypothetical protein [Gemmatimonadota bacterium]
MRDRYWTHVIEVLTGQVAAQLIPVLVSLAIARLFSPDAFGVFAKWLSVAMLISVVLSGRLEAALPLDASGPLRIDTLRAIITLILLLSIVSFLTLGAAVSFQPQSFSSPRSMLVLLVPAAALIALGQSWQGYAAAEGAFKRLGLMRITLAAFIASGHLIAGYVQPNGLGMAIGQVAGLAIAVPVCAMLVPAKGLVSEWQFSRVWAAWLRHRRFVLFSLPAITLSSLTAQLPVIAVSERFGAAAAGHLAMSMKALGAPIGLLGRAVLDVFKRQAAESFRVRGECKREYLQTFWVLLSVSAFCALVAVFILEGAFAIAFGEPWRIAGGMAVLLIPMFAMRFIASPLSYMAYIAEKQHVDLWWQVALLISVGLCLYLAPSVRVTLIAYSAAYTGMYTFYLALSYRFSLGNGESGSSPRSA